MTSLRIAFLGTPDFAVPALDQIVSGPDQLIMVVTQPDRKSGRNRRLTPSPVKRRAIELGIEVLQPEALRGVSIVQQLKQLNLDVFVVAAYGQILRQRLLDLPRLGCLNVHASLLPRWRGASPINHAILAGDTHSGITIMKMERGLDCGPIVRSSETEIGETETAGELHDRLAVMGADLTAEVLTELREGRRLQMMPQDDARSTYAPMLDKTSGRVIFDIAPDPFVRHVHAMTPWPSAVVETQRGPLRLCRARVSVWQGTAQPGEVVRANPTDGLTLAVGTGAVDVLECQRPGKRQLTAVDYLRGLQSDIVGEVWAG